MVSAVAFLYALGCSVSLHPLCRTSVPRLMFPLRTLDTLGRMFLHLSPLVSLLVSLLASIVSTCLGHLSPTCLPGGLSAFVSLLVTLGLRLPAPCLSPLLLHLSPFLFSLTRSWWVESVNITSFHQTKHDKATCQYNSAIQWTCVCFVFV